MRMDEQIVLIAATTASNGRGVPTETETGRTTVWADKLSAKRSEHYAANAAGIRVDIIFSINADDYNGQAKIEHTAPGQETATVYDVVRSYAVGRGRIELTCSKR